LSRWGDRWMFGDFFATEVGEYHFRGLWFTANEIRYFGF
jgi:hypothetical protein